MTKEVNPMNWKVKLGKSATLVLSVALLLGAAGTAEAQNKKTVEKANKLAQEGQRLFGRNDFKGALKKFDEAVKTLPNFPSAHFWRGLTNFNLKQYRPALAALNTSLSQGHDEFEVKSIRYRVLFLSGDPDGALADALRAIELDSQGEITGDATVYIVVGEIYLNKKNYAESNKFYKRCAELAPDTKEIFFVIASNHLELGEKAEAGIAALQALQRGTQYVAEASMMAGDYLYDARRLDEAAVYYEKALELRPNTRELYLVLSDIYRNENRFGAAIDTLRRGLSVFPDDADFLTNLSWNLSLANRHAEAVDAASRAIVASPNQPAAYTNRCRAYNDLQRYDLAVQSCNDALRLNPGDGESHLYLARAFEMQKQTARANENYRKAVEGLVKFVRANPNYSDGFYLLGNAQYKLLRFNEAIDSYRKCLALAPKFARARLTLGFAYLERGNKNGAMEQYRELLNIDAEMAATLKAEIDR
jgi:superkiller protein 3